MSRIEIMADDPEYKPQTPPTAEAGGAARRRFEDLPPAAQRALEEAKERRALYDAREADRPTEIGGRKGREPVRYGDWEVKGIASDF